MARVPQLGRGGGPGAWSWSSQPASVFIPSCSSDERPSHTDREAGGLGVGLRSHSVLPLGLGGSPGSRSVGEQAGQLPRGAHSPGKQDNRSTEAAGRPSPESCRIGPGPRGRLPVGFCRQRKQRRLPSWPRQSQRGQQRASGGGEREAARSQPRTVTSARSTCVCWACNQRSFTLGEGQCLR